MVQSRLTLFVSFLLNLLLLQSFHPSSMMFYEPWAGGVCDRHPFTGKYTKNTFSCIFPSVSSYQPPHEETCLMRTGTGFEMTYSKGTLIQCPFSKIISTRLSPGACAPQPWGLGQRTQILNFLFFLSFLGGQDQEGASHFQANTSSFLFTSFSCIFTSCPTSGSQIKL